MSIGAEYTRDERRENAERASFDGVPTHQVMLLHRHWIWANHARRTFEEALAEEEWSDVEDFTARTPWAMFLWYGLLWVVIEGVRRRQVKLGGQLVRDIRDIDDPLYQARNATFHVGEPDAYWDMRLFEIANNPSSANQIARVHDALGGLLLEELRRRHRE